MIRTIIEHSRLTPGARFSLGRRAAKESCYTHKQLLGRIIGLLTSLPTRSRMPYREDSLCRSTFAVLSS